MMDSDSRSRERSKKSVIQNNEHEETSCPSRLSPAKMSLGVPTITFGEFQSLLSEQGFSNGVVETQGYLSPGNIKLGGSSSAGRSACSDILRILDIDHEALRLGSEEDVDYFDSAIYEFNVVPTQIINGYCENHQRDQSIGTSQKNAQLLDFCTYCTAPSPPSPFSLLNDGKTPTTIN